MNARGAVLGEGRTAVYSNKGDAGDFNELNKEGKKGASIKGGGKTRIMHATNTSPSIISFYTFSPHPLPLLSFWFLVRFLSGFAMTSVRLLFPWRLLVSLPAQIALKYPIQQKKTCFLAWMAEGEREREEGAGAWRGGACWDHTAER